jgi:transposase
MMAHRIDYTRMKQLRDSGMRYSAIAAELGCCEESITNAVKRFGWDKRPSGGKRTIDAALLHSLWFSEMDTGDIAIRFGVSQSTLNTVRKRYKLPPRPKRRAESVLVDPTPSEIEERARQCRERHFAQRRGETEETTLQWRQGGAA